MKKIIGQTGGSSSKRPLNIRNNTNSYLQRTYNVRNLCEHKTNDNIWTTKKYIWKNKSG